MPKTKPKPKPKKVQKVSIQSFSKLRIINFLLAFALIGVAYTLITHAGPTPGFYGSVEADQAHRINHLRAAHGRSQLQHLECLNTVAENWTKAMADARGISHNPNLASQIGPHCGGAWSIIGENVGVGGDSASIWTGFYNSPGHRANAIDTRFTKMGVGAYWGPDSRLYITQVFAACGNCFGNWGNEAQLPADPAQTAPVAAGWNYENMDGGLTSKPAVTSWGDGRLDVFVRGGDNAMYQKFYSYSTGWSGWYSHGGNLTSAPAAVSWGPNRVDTVVSGPNNNLFHKAWTGAGWTNWDNLGGGLTSAPTIASWGAGRLDVFVRGGDNALYHKYYAGRWSDWGRLDGNLTSSPAAVSWGPNRIDVVVRGPDNAIYHRYWANGWSGWTNMGGYATSDPSISSSAPGRLDIFVRGGDNAHYKKSYNNGWTDWERIGGANTEAPASESWNANRIDVFSRNQNGSLNHYFR